MLEELLRSHLRQLAKEIADTEVPRYYAIIEEKYGTERADRFLEVLEAILNGTNGNSGDIRSGDSGGLLDSYPMECNPSRAENKRLPERGEEPRRYTDLREIPNDGGSDRPKDKGAPDAGHTEA